MKKEWVLLSWRQGNISGVVCVQMAVVQALVQYYSTNMLPFNQSHVTGLIIHTDCQNNTAQLYALSSDIFFGMKSIQWHSKSCLMMATVCFAGLKERHLQEKSLWQLQTMTNKFCHVKQGLAGDWGATWGKPPQNSLLNKWKMWLRCLGISSTVITNSEIVRWSLISWF